jgi:hypothetical protein
MQERTTDLDPALPATPSVASAWQRRLLVAESALLLGPVAAVALLAFAFALLSALRLTPAGALVLANGVVALLALFATMRGVAAYRLRGDDGLRALSRRTLSAMVAGVMLVGLGALAACVEVGMPTLDSGVLPANLLGLPAVVPCVHLLWLRANALRGEAVKTRRLWAAPAMFALALAALQWLTTGPLAFDRARWDALADVAHDPWFRRQRMADALLADEALVGRTRAEIVALLGEPDYDGEGMTYALGRARGIDGFGDDLLRLSFDADGRVAQAHVGDDD